MIINQKQVRTIAVVGDVHNQWEETDNYAQGYFVYDSKNYVLEQLKIDLVLFVGDFGNESVPIVRTISQLSLPKAVIMGNHDAWYTASAWGRKQCPYNRKEEEQK